MVSTDRHPRWLSSSSTNAIRPRRSDLTTSSTKTSSRPPATTGNGSAHSRPRGACRMRMSGTSRLAPVPRPADRLTPTTQPAGIAARTSRLLANPVTALATPIATSAASKFAPGNSRLPSPERRGATSPSGGRVAPRSGGLAAFAAVLRSAPHRQSVHAAHHLASAVGPSSARLLLRASWWSTVGRQSVPSHRVAGHHRAAPPSQAYRHHALHEPNVGR